MKRQALRLSLALAIIISACLLTRAQDFPWHDFERRTLQELIKINIEEDAKDLERYPAKGRMIFRGKVLPSVVRMTYTGDLRPIKADRKKFIELWAGTYSTADYAKHFESEMLFKEEAEEFWLPVQKRVIPYFEREIKKGEKLDLYIIRPGGTEVDGKLDWIFLVEEFQKLKE